MVLCLTAIAFIFVFACQRAKDRIHSCTCATVVSVYTVMEFFLRVHVHRASCT